MKSTEHRVNEALFPNKPERTTVRPKATTKEAKATRTLEQIAEAIAKAPNKATSQKTWAKSPRRLPKFGYPERD